MFGAAELVPQQDAYLRKDQATRSRSGHIASAFLVRLLCLWFGVAEDVDPGGVCVPLTRWQRDGWEMSVL